MKRLTTLSASLLLLVCAAAHAQGGASAPGQVTPEQAQRQMDEFLAKLPPEQQEKLRATFKDFQEARERQHVTVLDRQTLLGLRPDDLDPALFAYVQDRLDGEGAPAVSLSSLPPGLRAFYLSCLVEDDVLDGGFGQFFWNASPEVVERTPEALRWIGANEAAAAYEHAREVAASERALRSDLKSRQTLEAFSDYERATALNRLDASFVTLLKDFPVRRAALVHQHPERFLP